MNAVDQLFFNPSYHNNHPIKYRPVEQFIQMKIDIVYTVNYIFFKTLNYYKDRIRSLPAFEYNYAKKLISNNYKISKL